MQKKTLFFSLLVLLTAGCSVGGNYDERPASVQPAEGVPLRVEGATDDDYSTRTALTTNATFTAFTLYGFDNANTCFVNGVGFTKTGTEWAAATDATLMWPSGDPACNFFAVSPVESVDNIVMSSNGTIRSFHYSSMADGNTQQRDILVGSRLGVHSSDNDGKLLVHFNHVLAFARFKARCDQDGFTINIKSVTIHNLVKDGTFTFSNTDESTGTWTLGTQRVSYTITPPSVLTLAAADQYIVDKDGILMTIPQTTAARAWNPDNPLNTATDSYLEISCQIYKGSTYYVGNPGGIYASVYLPFSGELKQQTVYTFRLNMLEARSGVTGDRIIPESDIKTTFTTGIAADWSEVVEELTL